MEQISEEGLCKGEQLDSNAPEVPTLEHGQGKWNFNEPELGFYEIFVMKWFRDLAGYYE